MALPIRYLCGVALGFFSKCKSVIFEGIIDFFPGFRYDFLDFLSGKDDIPLCPLSLPPS